MVYLATTLHPPPKYGRPDMTSVFFKITTYLVKNTEVMSGLPYLGGGGGCKVVAKYTIGKLSKRALF